MGQTKSEFITSQIMLLVDEHVEKLTKMDFSFEEQTIKDTLYERILTLVEESANEAYEDGMHNERFWGHSSERTNWL